MSTAGNYLKKAWGNDTRPSRLVVGYRDDILIYCVECTPEGIETPITLEETADFDQWDFCNECYRSIG
jgi:hypothetical protein